MAAPVSIKTEAITFNEIFEIYARLEKYKYEKEVLEDKIKSLQKIFDRAMLESIKHR